jgi:ATP-dependent DNA ligase
MELRNPSVKNLILLQAECEALGIKVDMKGRASKEPYIAALREYHWRKDHPHEPLPAQIMPMLLGSWEYLDDAQAEAIEHDHHAWIVQPKMDGVRALFHIEDDHVRITSRMVSEVTYRLSEFQDNLPHLTNGVSKLNGTILDGELVCPIMNLNTGSTVTANSLQATMAILAAAPAKARQFQDGQHAHIRFHPFDVLRFRKQDMTPLPLMNRQDALEASVQMLNNEFIETVPSFVVNKPSIHHRIIDAGGEGTVWKRADAPYEPGRRVDHWIKRKRGIEVEAFVTGFKAGTNGHAALVGAVEFGVRDADGAMVPIGWVSGLSDRERHLLTDPLSQGHTRLASRHLGRRAILAGQDLSARSNRIRHARLVRWIDPIEEQRT